MKKQQKNSVLRVVKFAIFSGAAGVIQIVTFTLMNEIGNLPYWPSYLTALCLSVLFNFTVNRKFTFKAANNVPLAMLLVAAYYAVFTPLSTLWGDALTGIGWNEYAVLAGTMAINLSTEFLYQRFVVYRKSVDTNANGQRDSFRTVGDYTVDENGYLETWDTNTVGYFISEFVKEQSAPTEEETNGEETEQPKKEAVITYLGGGSYGKAYLVEKDGGKRIYKAVKLLDIATAEYETLKLIKEAAGEFIPEPYALHEASEGIPIAIIEEEYIEGVNLINPILSHYNKKKRRALAEQVAAVITEIRKKTADEFGKIGEEKYASWTEYYKKFAEEVLAEAEDGIADGRVKEAPVALAKKAFERFDEIFAEPVETACLVHADINIANVLVEPKTLKLKGIIDPYGSVFGDPEYELFQLQNMWGDRFFLYETVKNTFETSANCDLKCAFYALVNEIHCALKSGTSKGAFFDYLFKKQIKRLRNLLG